MKTVSFFHCRRAASRNAAFGLALLICGALFSAAAPAQTLVYRADVDGVPKTGTINPVAFDGVSHVSIISLTEQLGGSATILPTRARLELAGSTAWIQADDNRVNAFRIFTLSRPVIRTEDDYLIAEGDVPTFFEKAFRVTVGRDSAGAPPETVALEAPPEPAPMEIPQTAPVEQPPSREPAPSNVGVIVIDPGHGGFESGVEGPGGLAEKALVLDVATRLKALLEDRVSQRIVLTREDDLALNETQRASIVQNANADVLLTLHAGSSVSPDVRGSVVLYEAGNPRVHGRRMNDREQARRLGELIADSLREASAIPVRGFDTVPTRSMAHPGIAGVMVEIGCLTNAQDEAALQDDTTRVAIVNALARAVLTFLGVDTGEESMEAAG